MTEQDIRNAYVRIRTIDQTIPDDVLDYMKNAAIEKIREDASDGVSLSPDSIPSWLNPEDFEYAKELYKINKLQAVKWLYGKAKPYCYSPLLVANELLRGVKNS